ncbi:Competence protein ComM [compost metagenome]
MREKVQAAQARQKERYRSHCISWNSELSGRTLRRFTQLSGDAEALMRSTFEALGLSMRAYDRILKLARTIADIDNSDAITSAHLAEAIQYRQLDRRSRDLMG